jgi:signal-transduction protein with cAMP-binding, CBS, and nucleotidyltransferase domain
MEQIQQVIRQMIDISETEMIQFLSACFVQSFKKKQVLSSPNTVTNNVFFINKGLIRLTVLDSMGHENTTHFALENQFIADYASFIQKTKSIYTLQALEDTEVVVMPRASIEWGYQNLGQGDKLGRIIAEYYFIYLDNRLTNVYGNNPKERYDKISEIFPNIHNRVPQHMIASYLGITPIHLSRLKKQHRG